MLNSAEHEMFSPNKYENANNSSCSAMYNKKEFVIVSNLRFISMTQISCLIEVSMKKVL